MNGRVEPLSRPLLCRARAYPGKLVAVNDGDGDLTVQYGLTVAGDIELRNDGNGSLIVNDVIQAEGDIDYQAEGNVDMLLTGGGTLGGTITGANRLRLTWVAPVTLAGFLGDPGNVDDFGGDAQFAVCDGGPITYYPDADRPKVDYWKCL